MRLSLICTAFVLITSVVYAQTDGVTGNVAFEGNKRVTNAPGGQVSLMIYSPTARDMMVSNDPSFAGSMWEEYVRVKKWRLDTREDGYKSVYVKFRDAKGNVSQVIEAKIELDRTAPPPPELTVNYGRKYVSAGKSYIPIQLGALKEEDRYAMMISTRRDFLGANWQRYQAVIDKWPLKGQDGVKEIYVKFKDRAGNESQVASGEVILDRTPPENCKVIINNGDKFTRTPKVKLQFRAREAKEILFPPSMISPPDNIKPFQEEIDYTFEEGDGWKTVAVKFRDEAGNMTPDIFRSRIYLDTKPPTNGFIEINNGDRFATNHADINLKILALGAHEMIVGEKPDFSESSWENFTNVKSSFPVSPQDGLKIIYIKFRDRAGNESEVYADSIQLDQTPPQDGELLIFSDSIVIDNDNIKILKSKRQVVNLKISAKQAEYMMLANVSSFYGAKWEKYKEEYLNWELSNELEGKKSVFVRFRDEAGNISEPVMDFVVLDNKGPLNCSIDIDFKKEYTIDPDGKVRLQLSAVDADSMMISNDPTFSSARWEPFKEDRPWMLSDGDGLKTVYAKFKDIANNVTETNNRGVPLSDNINLDRKPPFNCSVLINKGQKETNNIDKVVQVKVNADEAEFMQISNIENFSSIRWARYSEKNIYHQLTGEDGNKVVYVRFRDEAGNISDVFSDSIILDRTPPMKGEVKIVTDGNQEFTSKTDVKLQLKADEAVEMLISNNFSMADAKWQPFQPTLDWNLASSNGLKTVYVKFRDKIGNESSVTYDRIGVDTEAPENGQITIVGLDKNGNYGIKTDVNTEKYCTNIDKKVILRLRTRNASQMMISNNPNFSGAKWQPYQSIIYDYVLEGEDGVKTIYAKFKDEADNSSEKISDQIVLDRQEPYSENVIINSGAKYTNNIEREVDLALKAEGANEMIISNSPNFLPPAKWEAYQPSAKHRLLNGDGVKEIFVKFRDSAYNESSIVRAEIILDTEPPVSKSVTINGGKASTENNQVTINLLSYGADKMMVANDPTFTGGFWDDYKSSFRWTLSPDEGLKTVYIKLKDMAGNEAGPFSKNITVVYQKK